MLRLFKRRKSPRYFMVEGMILSEATLRKGPNYADNPDQFKFHKKAFDVTIRGFRMHVRQLTLSEVRSYETSVSSVR